MISTRQRLHAPERRATRRQRRRGGPGPRLAGVCGDYNVASVAVHLIRRRPGGALDIDVVDTADAGGTHAQ
ncbi:hypothetical protein [Rhodococcus erythropolis]|uniref:hypothetical protein n=1 Tax=Rhodococcus erythropolis TaxID=1833 RepID=UPI001BE735D5|nr:hypothetical protein [Rhodococcus erythropolis]MBT2263401.1 hypothetical protein [Rhodococcus erythropolis]